MFYLNLTSKLLFEFRSLRVLFFLMDNWNFKISTDPALGTKNFFIKILLQNYLLALYKRRISYKQKLVNFKFLAILAISGTTIGAKIIFFLYYFTIFLFKFDFKNIN